MQIRHDQLQIGKTAFDRHASRAELTFVALPTAIS
jgi:hypothetical protein